MRLVVFVVLCLVVAGAVYEKRSHTNRLHSNAKRSECLGGLDDLEYGCGGFEDVTGDSGHDLHRDDYDSEEDEELNDYYGVNKQRHQRQHQSKRHADEDKEGDLERKYEKEDQDQRGGHSRLDKRQVFLRQQQRQEQCEPKYSLLQEIERANVMLAAKLYKQAKQETDDKNTLVSPAAVQLALAALDRGSSGETKQQIARLIGAGLPRQQRQQAYSALANSLKGEQTMSEDDESEQQNSKVKCATGVIIKEDSPVDQQYARSAKTCFDVAVKKCDFQRQAQKCRQQINRLVSIKTEEKLPLIATPDAITENTKMLVVNALHAQAEWGKAFSQHLTTKKGRFYPLGSEKSKSVQVLQSHGRFNYYEDEQLRVVGVPTKNEDLTLYVLVPKEQHGLTRVEKQSLQNGQQVKQILDECDSRKQLVRIELPTVQITHKMDVKQTLRESGVRDAFDVDHAQFDGILGRENEKPRKLQYDEDEEETRGAGGQLHLNKFIHQVALKVSEHGIGVANRDRNEETDEPSTGTPSHVADNIFHRDQAGSESDRRQTSNDKHHVRADHAFALILKHKPSNQIVLIGRVIDAAQQMQKENVQTPDNVDQL